MFMNIIAIKVCKLINTCSSLGTCYQAEKVIGSFPKTVL